MYVRAQWRKSGAGLTAAFLLAGLLLVTPASARHYSADDLRLSQGIEQALEAQEPLMIPQFIAVEASNGTVRLIGQVADIGDKRLAEDLARNFPGVLRVENYLRVEPTTKSERQLASDVRRALARNSETGDLNLTVRVRGDNVTLSGTVDRYRHSALAEFLASHVVGIDAVHNRLNVREPVSASMRAQIDANIRDQFWTLDEWLPTMGRAYTGMTTPGERAPIWVGRGDEDIREAIKTRMLLDTRVLSFRPTVSVDDGIVTLTGTVGGYEARLAAEEIARGIAGVTEVRNYLTVSAAPGVGATFRTEPGLLGQARRVLQQDRFFDNNKLLLTIDGGVVTLTGEVDSQFELDRAAALVRDIPGITGVINNLKIREQFRVFRPGAWLYDYGEESQLETERNRQWNLNIFEDEDLDLDDDDFDIDVDRRGVEFETPGRDIRMGLERRY